MTLAEHQAAVLSAHARYALARRRLADMDVVRSEVEKERDSARAELDVLALREPKP